MVKIPFSTDFGSLNVSNAAAIALYQLQELSPEFALSFDTEFKA